MSSPQLIGDLKESKNSSTVTIVRNINASKRTTKGQSEVWESTANNVPVIANSYGSYTDYNGKTLTSDYQYIYTGIATMLGKIYNLTSWGTTTSKNFAAPGMYFNIRTTLTQPPSVYYVSGSTETALETGMRIPATGAQPHRNASFKAIVGQGTTLDTVKVTCLSNSQSWSSTSETINITDLPVGVHQYRVEATSHVTGNTSVAYKTEYTITIAVAPYYTVTFDPTGGEVSPTSKEVRYGETYGELPAATRENYKAKRI